MMDIKSLVDACREVASRQEANTMWNYDPIECAALNASASAFRHLAEILESDE